MDILGTLINAALTGLTVALMTYVISKRMLAQAKRDIKQEAEAWLNSDVGQKAIFSIGALIANGAKSGFQLQNPRGKGGFEGLIMNVIGQFIQSKLPAVVSGEISPAAATEKFKTEY